MSAYLGYLLAGIGGGAVIASLALGLVLTWRASGVVNFAHAAMGTYVAFAYFEFRERGDLILPVLGLPDRLHLLDTPTLAAALVFAVIVAGLLGLGIYWLVFRPLRQAPALARVVASLGLYLYLQEITRLRFPTVGASAVTRRPVLPEGPVRFLGTVVSANRLLLAGAVLVVTAALVVVFRTTRFGLATRAASDNERGAVLTGISPDRVGALNWMLASVLAGLAVVLIEPIAGLDPATTSLLVVPALAAALLGGLTSFPLTAGAGLAIGMVQSLILGYAVRPDTTWIPRWLPTTGLQQTVPVVLVLVVLIWRSDPLPTRETVAGRGLPSSPTPRRVALWAGALSVVVLTVLFTTGAVYRQAMIVTLIAVLLSLSVVVITGYVGQISLAQLAFAGLAGFTAIEAADRGAPFPLAVLAGTGVAVVAGLLVAVPATRVRGMSLAVATLAMAVAIEQLVLGSPTLSGGVGGRQAPRPYLFGIDVGISARGSDNFRPVFGVLVLVVVVVAGVVVANLRRNHTGLRWLAVRANERAAAAVGIDVARVKLGAFALSSALAGLAGCAMAFATTTLSTTSFLVIGSLVALALTYVGGISSITGAIVAGSLAQAGIITATVDAWTGSRGGPYVFVISGLALMVLAILAPEGIAGLARRAHLRRLETAVTGAALLEVANLTVRYGGVVAVDGVSFTVDRGEVVGLIGPNGAGKTTCIDALTGFQEPDAGRVTFDGRPLDGLAPHQRVGRGFSRTFQSLELFEDLSVRENLLVAATTPSWRSTLADAFRVRPADHRAIDEVLDLLGLSAVGERRPSELSNGQRHLVALGRALAPEPSLVLLDEPAAGLDTAESVQLGRVLAGLPERGISVLLVDHDMALVLGICDRVHVLDFGRLIASGTPTAIRADAGVVAAYLGSTS